MARLPAATSFSLPFLLVVFLLQEKQVNAFAPVQSHHVRSTSFFATKLNSKRLLSDETKKVEVLKTEGVPSRLFDPWNASSDEWNQYTSKEIHRNRQHSKMAGWMVLPLIALPQKAMAAATAAAVETAETATGKAIISAGDFNPENFKPVCPASDGFYRFLQGTTEAVVGEENFVEYGPLIAGGLLRVRLELCVVESFFNEAVGPFIQQNGLSWILPLHETVETFLAGTIFAVATTFILVGSSKLISVIATYGDLFFGVPCRLLGGFAFDRARGKPVTLDIGLGPFKTRLVGPPNTDSTKNNNDNDDTDNNGAMDFLVDFENLSTAQIPIVLASGAAKAVGETSKVFRDVVETIDLFIGRYLVLMATGYIGLKFLHFKIFPDFPPF